MRTLASATARAPQAVESLWKDVRYALRSLRRAPGLTVSIVLTLGLGVGANAAVFSVLDRVLLRPPSGVTDPSGIRRVYAHNFSDALGWGHDGRVTASVRLGDFVDLEAAARGSAQIVADHSRGARLDVGGTSATASVYASFVSPRYFAFLGVHPELGRFFGENEGLLGEPSPVIVISDALWRSQFGADPGVLGHTLRLDGNTFTIIGVAAREFTGLDFMPRDVWVPLANADRAWLEKQPVVSLYARTSPGTGQRQLEERLTTRYRQAHDGDQLVESSSRIFLGPLNKAQSQARQQSGMPERSLDLLTRLAAVGGLVCVLAMANVASLLLMRAVRRRREIGMRLALGATRSRLVSQLAVESVLLAFGASAIALLIAFMTGGALRHALASAAKWPDAVVDPHVVAFAIVVSVTIAMSAGLAPALFAIRTDVASTLLSSSGSGTRSRWRVVLLAAQAALCMALLAAAGVFLQSLRHALMYDRGFDVEQTIQIAVRLPSLGVTVTPSGPAGRPDTDSAGALSADVRVARMEQRAREVPGVVAVGQTFSGLEGYGIATKVGPTARDTVGVSARGPFLEFVEPEFLRAAGLSVEGGRAFVAADDRAPVVVLNEALAAAVFPGGRAVGECVHMREPGSPCRTVVGVVQDVHPDLSAAAAYRAYVPMAQAWATPNPALVPRYIVVRMRGVASRNDAARVRAAILPLVPDATMGTVDVQRTVDLLEPELRPWRVAATLFLVLGALGLAAAVTGIYGLVAYEAAQRERELGVRVALGAPSWAIVRLVLGSGLRVVLIGVGAGTVLALAVGRVVASLLFATSPYDPVVLGLTALTLTLAAGAASVVPAWRAAHVDPAAALRAE